MARTVHPDNLPNNSRSFSRHLRQTHQSDQHLPPPPDEPAPPVPRPSTSRSAGRPGATQTSCPSRAKPASARLHPQDEEPTGKTGTRIRTVAVVGEESEKKRGKRRAAEEDEAGGDSGGGEELSRRSGDDKPTRRHSAPSVEPIRLVESISRQVSRKTITRSWRPLSYSARLSIRDTLQQSALDVLARLRLKDRAIVQGLLARIEAKIDVELSTLVVPSSGLSSRPAGAADGARQVDFLEEEEMRRKIVAWDQARVEENKAIAKLKKAIKDERRLLEDDEERLQSFEDARAKVEKKEQRDMAKALHPLVTDLLATASARDLAHTTSLLSRAEPSKRWIADAAKVVDTKPKRAPGDDDSEDDAEEAEYDAAKDAYLIKLQARLAGSLAKVEQAVAGLGRVRSVVDAGERALVGLM